MAGENRTKRNIIPVMLTLLVLGIFLSLYFLKYIPQQQRVYNNRAFLELEQIAKAVQGRTTGYSKAISFYLKEPQSTSPILSSLKFTPRKPTDKDSLNVQATTLTLDTTTGKEWQISFPLSPLADPQHPRLYNHDPFLASIHFDTLLTPIIATYRDLFENYLLIRRPDFRPDSDRARQGGILFNSGDLPLGNVFDMDSLLKKSDGLSLLYIHDLNIEGIPYKLFLYPFQLGKEQIYLAGLISTSGYNAVYKGIPLNLFAPATILILLLLINLPILKIFILGAVERITDWDIRLIIGSYFVAAFTAFFLFSWIFLTRIQSADNEVALTTLSDKIQNDFTTELGSICGQLQKWDSTYATLIGSSGPSIPGQIRLLQGWKAGPPPPARDSVTLDSLFHPDLYPNANYAFWIDSGGKWIATWSAKKYNSNPLLLSVGDRKYFQNYLHHDYLKLPGTCPFTIEPTWSRLDGGYTITVVTGSSFSGKAWKRPGPGNDATPPMLLGLSAQFYSVTNPVMPDGYNFSMIDESGKVLYDSRPGRALQTDILKESDDPSAILECARFRTYRYFDQFRLKGLQVSMIASPMKGLPYTLLVYYNRAGEDDFQLHLISLSAFFTTCVLVLLILSTVINAWTGKKPVILLAPSTHFEWLRPLPRKNGYYQHLMLGMLGLLGIYVASWVVIPLILPDQEFSLFFISLAFPFYIAWYYYRLREMEKSNPIRAILPILLFLTLAILIIQSFSFSRNPLSGWISAVVQGLLLLTAHLFLRRFPPGQEEKTDSSESSPLSSSPPAGTAQDTTWLTFYPLAIITGVFMISIVPACGIFWLLFRQETSLQHNSHRLEMARNINERRIAINRRSIDYKSGPHDPSLRQLKFGQGIYLYPGDSIITPDSAVSSDPFLPVAPQYAGIHQLFFPKDSNVLASTTGAGSWDGSWGFFRTIAPHAGDIRLNDNSPADWIDKEPLRLKAGPEASLSAVSLMIKETCASGALFVFLYFGAQLLGLFLAYKVSRSLAIRIFLIDLFEDQACPPSTDDKSAQPGDLSLFQQIRAQEIKLSHSLPGSAETILCNLQTHEELYRQHWIILPPVEKFTLYDLAKDGFANYKTGNILYTLLKKELLVFRKGQPELITDSFREYVLQQSDDPDVVACWKQSIQKGQWQAFKTPLMILFSAFGLFLFVTQDDLFQKLTGLFTTLISIGTQFSSVFDKIIQKLPEKKSDL